jgi:hypothetical protein
MKLFGVVVSEADPFNHWTRRQWLHYAFEIAVKSAYTLCKPAILSVMLGIVWRHYIYGRHLYFDGDQEPLLTGFVVISALAWGLFATKAFDVSLDQFYEARRIIRQKDFNKLIERYDEKLPPLMHILIFFFALMVLIPLALIRYEHVSTGCFTVVGVTFILLLAFFVLREIDKPFSGTWTLNNMPEEWKHKDMNAERAAYIVQLQRTQSVEGPDGMVVHQESLTIGTSNGAQKS